MPVLSPGRHGFVESPGRVVPKYGGCFGPYLTENRAKNNFCCCMTPVAYRANIARCCSSHRVPASAMAACSTATLRAGFSERCSGWSMIVSTVPSSSRVGRCSPLTSASHSRCVRWRFPRILALTRHARAIKPTTRSCDFSESPVNGDLAHHHTRCCQCILTR